MTTWTRYLENKVDEIQWFSLLFRPTVPNAFQYKVLKSHTKHTHQSYTHQKLYRPSRSDLHLVKGPPHWLRPRAPTDLNPALCRTPQCTVGWTVLKVIFESDILKVIFSCILESSFRWFKLKFYACPGHFLIVNVIRAEKTFKCTKSIPSKWQY